MTTDTRYAPESSEDGFHEIHLSGKQLVFLFMATTVVSIVIFLCGVLVGRGVRTEASVDSIAPPSAAGVQPDDGTAPAPSSATNVAASELSYYERLGNAEPPSEIVRSGTEVPEAGAGRERAAAPPPPAARPAAEPATGPRAEPATAADPPSRPAEVAPTPASRVAGGWAVQVAAVRQKGEAEAIAARLVRKGYDAYVVAPAAGASTPMYRVRVGSYQDRREAEQTMQRLTEQERFKPWITR